jgi:hypothetical protein
MKLRERRTFSVTSMVEPGHETSRRPDAGEARG